MLTSIGARARAFWRRLQGWRALTPEEIEGALRVPVLAVVPHIERRRMPLDPKGPVKRRIHLDGRWRSRLLMHYAPDGPAAAAYSILADELRTEARDKGRKALLCTSSVTGEGTSLTCANLAIAARRDGVKTLVIEGHIRAPRISALLGMDLEPGLTGCLSRYLPASRVIQKSEAAGIDLLPAGRPAAYPEALWASPAFQRLMTEVRSMYDLILFEAPPALPYPDTPVLAEKLDGIVMIHQFGRVSTERLQKAVDKFGIHREKLVGLVLNDVPAGRPGRPARRPGRPAYR